MGKHTPEPWFAKREGFSTVYIEARIGGGLLQEVATCGPYQYGSEQQDANARRIVACVNACTGLDNPADEIDQIRNYIPLITERMLKAEQQRDDLRTALEALLADMRLRAQLRGDVDDDGCVILDCGSGVLIKVNSAITKAKD